ncbi:MAG: LPS export ABC transporter periplasmic protein LptC [Mariprofundaceae bacterium]
MHHRRWTLIKWAALSSSLGSIMLAGVLMWQAGPSTPDTSPVNQAASNRTQVEAPVIVERRDGRIVWQLRAGEARQQLNGKMLLTEPELTLFTESGSSVPIRSRQAWFDPIRRNVRFQGKVQVRFQAWDLRCASLIYNSSRDELRVPGAFTLKGKSMQASGKKMRIDRPSERLFVEGGVRIDDQAPQWTGSGS